MYLRAKLMTEWAKLTARGPAKKPAHGSGLGRSLHQPLGIQRTSRPDRNQTGI
jgi:hypothetical protein